MIRIRTDIAHHCGPRVAFWAATWSGIVWALALVRTSAMRNSFQAKIRTIRKVATRPGHGDRQHDRADDPVDRRPVDRRRFLELDRQRREVVAHQPDDDRQVGRDVRDDQRGEAVEQADLLEQDVHRDDHRDRRQDPLRDHPERDVAVAERPREPSPDGLGQDHEDAEAATRRRSRRARRAPSPSSSEREAADEQPDDPEPRAYVKRTSA